MERQKEILLAKIFVNSLEHMQNTDEDWKKVIDAYSKTCGSDAGMAKRSVQYANLLEEILKGEPK